MRHATVVDAAVRQTGYHIIDHFLQLSGLCPACDERAGEARATPGDGA